MKTLVLGASDNPERYSYKAVKKLLEHGHEVLPVGNKRAEVFGLEIRDAQEIPKDVDTLSLYVGPTNQVHYESYIMQLHPRRVIFNPGTENPELQAKLSAAGISYEEACTLVLLSTGQF